MGPSRLGQKGPVKIILPIKRESGEDWLLNHPTLGMQRKMPGNKNGRKKGNNKSKAESSFRMAKHTTFMKSYYISQLKGHWWEHEDGN